MKKAILALLFVCAAAYCPEKALAADMPGVRAPTTGWGDESVQQSLAEEFAKCSAFYGVAAGCAKHGSQEQQREAAARYTDAAKRFYQGGYMLAGQDFTRRRIQYHDTALRRRAGRACEDFPKFEQQYQKLCDDTARRLPRKLQRP